MMRTDQKLFLHSTPDVTIIIYTDEILNTLLTFFLQSLWGNGGNYKKIASCNLGLNNNSNCVNKFILFIRLYVNCFNIVICQLRWLDILLILTESLIQESRQQNYATHAKKRTTCQQDVLATGLSIRSCVIMLLVCQVDTRLSLTMQLVNKWLNCRTITSSWSQHPYSNYSCKKTTCQQAGESSANTSWLQVSETALLACLLQVCYKFCVFTCLYEQSCVPIRFRGNFQ